ncbi:hypothetical protein ES705_36353 [subsurface metagenome]
MLSEVINFWLTLFCSMRERLKITSIILLIFCDVHASKPEPVYSSSANSMPDYSTLFFTFDYSTQTNTLGVINETVKQPNYTAGVGFFSKYNFDLSFQSLVTQNGDTSFTKTTTEFDFMAGYTYRPSDELTIYPSYTHMEYSKSISPLLSAFSDIAQLDIYYNKGVYYGGLSTSMLFGERNMFYFSFQNALGFYKENFLFRNSLLSIQLEFDANISDKNFYNKIIYELWNSEEFLLWINDEYPRSLAMMIHSIEANGLETTKNLFYNYINERDKSVFGPSYTITSVNFMLPVYYSVGNFMFNFTTFLIIPTTTSSFYQQNTQLIFNAGVAYSIDF